MNNPDGRKIRYFFKTGASEPKNSDWSALREVLSNRLRARDRQLCVRAVALAAREIVPSEEEFFLGQRLGEISIEIVSYL